MLHFIGVYDYTVILTYLGLISSVFGITQAIHGDYKVAVFCLAFSGVCDAFDGRVARRKKNRTEDGKNFGFTFRLGASIPFLVSSGNDGYPGKAMSLSFGGGIIFRARPWDYMDLTLSALLNLSTYDYRSLVLGVSIEPRFDLYLSDNLFLSLGGEYGSAIDRFLFKDAFLDRGFSEARFSFTLGVGYAFGGYSG